MDADQFHSEVYRVVRLIPHGKVTSYGHVAKLIGMPRNSRHVGQGSLSSPPQSKEQATYPAPITALKFLNVESDVPWQRVISSAGKISSRGPGTDGAQRQREALELEGVEVRDGRTEEMLVDFREYGWFPEPERLEGEEA